LPTTKAPPVTTSDPPLVHLGAKSGVLEYLRSLWARREFALAIPSAELHAQHRNTMLGGLWHLLNPILQIGIYYLVFGKILDVNRGVDNLIGFLAVGVFIFHFTTKSLNAGARSITSNAGLLRAISFPRAILPLAAVLSEFAAFGYAIVTMLIAVLLTGEPLSWTWLVLVPVIVLQTMFNIGIAFFVARLSYHFRDVQQVLRFIIRLWFYGSAVIYPATRLTEKRPDLEWVLTANPLFAFMDLARTALLKPMAWGAPDLWLSASAWAVGSLVLGFLYFRARENEYGRA
jgi:teichoic acid transport system permease protein